MNDRIKELAEQAGFGSAWFEESPPGYPALPKEGMLKELAESIVRQCGFELVDESMQYNSPLIQEFTVKVANRLKARFGVNI